MEYQTFPQNPWAYHYDQLLTPYMNHQMDLHLDVQNSWQHNIDPLLQDYDLNSPNQQPKQRFPTDPQIILFNVRRPAQESYQINFNQTYEATAALPLPPIQRKQYPTSPSPESASICSSAHSPGRDGEYSQEQHHGGSHYGGYELSRSISGLCQNLPDIWPAGSHFHAPLPAAGGINMSEVQSVPDPQEITYQEDEGYMEMDAKADSGVDTDIYDAQTNYRSQYPSQIDEGLGQSPKSQSRPQSVKESISPRARTIRIEAPVGGDISDSDGETEDIPIPDDDEDADTEYTPRGPRSSQKRRSSRTTFRTSTIQSPTRTRVAKSSQTKSSSSMSCKSCKFTAKDATSLNAHTSQSHVRAYICPFGFAGCSSTFASKNEWKRHTTSQHLCLHYWLCELGACGSGRNPKQSEEANGKAAGSPEFNRKDLFTQHLRRMHAPANVKRTNKMNTAWEEQIKELQESSKKIRRLPPSKACCPLKSCGQIFEGKGCWDERMEHVGRHLERSTNPSAANTERLAVDQGDDELVVDWAQREGVIQRKLGGGWMLCGAGGDRDADGEDE